MRLNRRRCRPAAIRMENGWRSPGAARWGITFRTGPVRARLSPDLVFAYRRFCRRAAAGRWGRGGHEPGGPPVPHRHSDCDLGSRAIDGGPFDRPASMRGKRQCLRAPHPAHVPRSRARRLGTPTSAPFRVEVPAGGARRPAPAHRRDALAAPGARRRSVAGRAAGDDPGARPLLGDRVRLAPVRGEAERAAAVQDRDRRGGHPLHPREVAARERVAADHDARLARLGHRAARDRRSADRPDRARRTRRGRVRPRAAVRSRLRLLRRADRARLEPRPRRAGLGGADAPPRLHPLRRPGRRRGRRRHRRDGPPGARGAGRHPHEPARDRRWAAAPSRGHRARNARRSSSSPTFRATGFGYFLEQATRPQTIGYALLDSPVALAAWMLDHDTDSYYKISRAFVDGQPSGSLTRDHILDNITLYWLTGTGASAARSYWESGRAQALAAGQAPPPVSLPVGFTTFPGEIFRPRAAGSSRPTPPSPTSTRPTGAATSPPGRSPSCSRPRSGRPSGRCAQGHHHEPRRNRDLTLPLGPGRA